MRRSGIVPKLALLPFLFTAAVSFLSPARLISPEPPAITAAISSDRSEVLSSEPETIPLSPVQLKQRIQTILGKPNLAKVVFSASIVNGESGEIVYEKNPHLGLIPASNMKIVTTAAALECLGPEFAFITRVGLCGEKLMVKGSGDPLLGDKEIDLKNGRRAQPVIQEIARRLRDLGVSEITDIVLDTSIFDSQRVHPSWPQNQLHQKYACEVSGINYHGNSVAITAVHRQGKIVLTLDPPTDYLRLRNSLTIWKSRESWFSVSRTDVPNELLIQGNCRTEAGPYAVAVENPALFFGHLLRSALVEAGIGVAGEILEQRISEECEVQEVAEFATPLSEVLKRTNKDSFGLAAEALFKRISVQSNSEGDQGSWQGGRKVVFSYLTSLGLSEREFVISDGSGLSRENRLSANVLTRILLHLASGPDWNLFKNSLAVGGLDGTIENHFWEKAYRGRVLAKSGYIQAVRALSGVAHTDSGDYLFSFLANKAGNGARTAIDQAVKAIIDWGARPSPSRRLP